MNAEDYESCPPKRTYKIGTGYTQADLDAARAEGYKSGMLRAAEIAQRGIAKEPEQTWPRSYRTRIANAIREEADK